MNTFSILLADDEEFIRAGISLDLSNQGFRVVAVASGEEAVAKFKSEKFDLVITDFMMEGMDGLDVLREIKNINPSTPVIILTAHGTLSTVIEALRKGAADYLLKPCLREELFMRINRCREKLELESQLSRYREKLRMLSLVVEESPNSILITDADGIIQYVNRALTEISGYSAEELIGKTPRVFKSGVHPPLFYENLWKTIQSGKEFRDEFRNKKKNGELIWEYQSIYPVKGDNGEIKHFISIKIDDTERKLTEEKLKFYSRELERSNKELTQFAHVASHDLRAPLLKIIAFGSRLETLIPHMSEESRDYLRRMQTAAARMQTLIDDLLKYARISTKGEPFAAADCNQIVREVLDDLEVSIKQGGARIILGDLPTLDADVLQIRQLFQNLIGNALKFHKKGVPPEIDIRGERLGGGAWKICVRDNGIGLDKKYAGKIFEPFERLHGQNVYEGTGLGLAICKKIVERHAWEITVNSAPGAGAEFEIFIPSQQPASRSR